MPASFWTEVLSLIHKLISASRALRERLKFLSPFRWVFLVLGIASIARGQYLMEHRQVIGNPLPQATLWNDVYRLAIVNFDNVLYALPYFFGGAFLCALTVLPQTWKFPFTNWDSSSPSRDEARWRRYLPHILVSGSLFIFLLVQLARHKYADVFPILWLVSISIFTYFTWRWDRNTGKDLSLGITVTDLFWIACLLLLGFVINTLVLEDIPTILIQDEGSFWETARAIAIKELHPPFFDSGVYSFPVASSIYQGWILRIFGLNLWAWRFSSVFAGVLTVIPLYLLGREWFNRRTAIAAVIIMIANPYFIAFSRMGYNNSQSLFPVTLAVFFFAVAARKGSVFYLWLAGIVAGIGFYTYSAAWIGLVTLCLSILYILVMKQVKWRQALASLGIMLLAWSVMVAPRVAYAASGENASGLLYKLFETSFVNTFYAKVYYGEADLLQTTPLIHFSENDTFFYDPVIYEELLLRGTVRTILALFDPHIVSEHFLVTGFAGVISPVFFLIGLTLSLRLWMQLRFGLPLIWLTSGLVFMSIIAAFPPRHTHFVSAIPVLALISGIGLSATVEGLAESVFARWTRIQSILQKILLGISCILIVYFGCQKYFVRMPFNYPPLFEDIASWIAWKTKTPANIIYLGQKDSPHRVGYLVDAKLARHHYQSLFTKDFPPNAIPENRPTIIFIESQEEIDDSIKWKLPGFSVPIPYTYTDGTILGYVMTNTIIDLSPNFDWEEGRGSLLNTPVRYILAVLVILVMAAGISSLRNRNKAIEIKPNQLKSSP